MSVLRDSAAVISQINGERDTKHPNLIPYKEYVLTLLPHFEEITFEHFPREENQLEDTLATMSSIFKVRWDNEAPQITIERLDEPAHCYEIVVPQNLPSHILQDLPRSRFKISQRLHSPMAS